MMSSSTATPSDSGPTDDPLAGLTEEQKAAAGAPPVGLLLAAAAGSGKTRTLVARARHLVASGIPAASVVAVTFSRKAAEELRHRLPAGLAASTLHAFARQWTVRAGPADLRKARLLTDTARRRLLLDLARDLPGADLADGAAFRTAFDRLRSRARRPSEADLAAVAAQEAPAASLRLLAERYAQRLRSDGAADFDEVLFAGAETFDAWAGRPPTDFPRHLLVDEAQDLNAAQWAMLDALASAGCVFTFVGDPDQCIYEFRGASSASLHDAPRRFAPLRVLFLTENFRSQAAVVRLAAEVLKAIPGPWERTVRPVRAAGETPDFEFYPSRRLEADGVARAVAKRIREGVPAAEIAVLARTQFRLQTVAEALRKEKIPVTETVSDGLPERALHRLRLLRDPEDREVWLALAPEEFPGFGASKAQQWRSAWTPGTDGRASLPPRFQPYWDAILDGAETARKNAGGEALVRFLERSVGEPTEPLGESQRRRLRAWSGAGNADVEDLLLSVDASDRADGVRLMTVHQAKGLEWSQVFLIGMETGTFPHERSGADGLTEERRLFYVAVTRARDRLTLSGAGRQHSHGSEASATPSSFIERLPTSVLKRRNIKEIRSASGAHPYF